jgi:beta-lactam-binding protein with PASTA domain
MGLFKKIKLFVFSKHFFKHSGLVILFYLVIITLTIFYLDLYTNHGEKIEVPNFVGQHVSSVQSTIDDLDLQYEILDSIYDPTKPEGTILEQDPASTKLTEVYVKEGRIIRFRVSKKLRLIEMPSLIDKSERFAQSILENRGLKYSITYEETSEADGAVLKQLYKGRTLREGEKVPAGAVITLIVGRNSATAPVEIPNLVGMSISQARSYLSSFGNLSLSLVCGDCMNADDSTSAVINSQSPEYLPGTTIPGGSSVTVYASKGGM